MRSSRTTTSRCWARRTWLIRWRRGNPHETVEAPCQPGGWHEVVDKLQTSHFGKWEVKQMCKFFSAIVLKTGEIRWCEDDSHEETIRRLGVEDDGDKFVRIELNPDGKKWKYVVDCPNAPDWFQRMTGIETRVTAIAKKVRPKRDAYQKAIATAEDAYQKAKAPAWDAYQKAKATAEDAYRKAKAPAWDAYQKAKATAWDAYQKAIGRIAGYVPTKQ